MANLTIQFNETCGFYKPTTFTLESEITIIQTTNSPIILSIQDDELNENIPVFGVKFICRTDDNGKFKNLIMKYSVNGYSYIDYYPVLELNTSGCDYIRSLTTKEGQDQIRVSAMQTWPKTGMLM